VITVIERDGLLEHVTAMGEHLAGAIDQLEHPLIVGVRGRGLLRGIVFAEPVAATVSEAALDAGFIVNAPSPQVLRLAPPLVVTAGQLDTFVAALPGLLDRARETA
jgi:acetylornithine aminotransferase